MEKKYTTPIKAVLFDNDGTLVDTEWAYEWAHEQLTGHKLDMALKAKLMGKASYESCAFVIDYYGLKEDVKEFSDRRTKLLEHCWDKVTLLPGAEKLINLFYDMKIPMAVATASRKHVYDMKVANFKDLYAKFDHVVNGNDVKKGKPEPDIFLLALSKWEGIKPEEVLVFEDSPLGIKAANNAGMASVFIPDKRLNIEEVLKAEDAHPTLIIPSLENFDPNMFNWSPKQQ